MSIGTKGKPEGLLGLTTTEARTILLGVLCTDSAGKIDFGKLAAIAPYKNVTSASSSYRQAKKKFLDSNADLLDASASAAGAGTPASASAPTTTSAAAENLNPDASGAAASPGPKATPKKSPAKRRKSAAAASGGDADAGERDDEGESSVTTPKPKRQRKTPVKKKAVVKVENEGQDEGENGENAAPLVKREPEPEPEQSDLQNILGEETAAPGMIIKRDEDEVMSEANIDAEFDAMEQGQGIMKAEAEAQAGGA